MQYQELGVKEKIFCAQYCFYYLDNYSSDGFILV